VPSIMSKALLILIVLAFLLLIGGGISKWTHLAVAPPIYVPMGYYYKSEIVWSALTKGRQRLYDPRGNSSGCKS
jgi:hypothetical protein